MKGLSGFLNHCNGAEGTLDFGDLLQIRTRLSGKGGNPWNKQTTIERFSVLFFNNYFTCGIGNSFLHVGQESKFLGLTKGLRQSRQNKCWHDNSRGFLQFFLQKLHVFEISLLFVLVSPSVIKKKSEKDIEKLNINWEKKWNHLVTFPPFSFLFNYTLSLVKISSIFWILNRKFIPSPGMPSWNIVLFVIYYLHKDFQQVQFSQRFRLLTGFITK